MPPLHQATVRSAVRQQHTITTRGHTLLVDEPPPSGDGAGPTPQDLLMAAIGSCAAITIRLYAERKGWDPGEVTVDVTHEREPERGADGVQVPVDVITERITMTGDLTAEQRERLRDIAGRCPVARMVKGTTRLTSELVP